jgi:hypothetical protein
LKKITLVTALFDIGRGDLDSGFKRSFEHYIQCFKRLLTVDFPMVIYIEPENEHIVWESRSRDNTHVILKTKDDLRKFPFYEQAQSIRKNEEWLSRAGWLRESTQASLELYNPLVMSKMFFLNDASLFNFFDTKYFLWIDGGITNTVSIEGYLNDPNFEDKIIKNYLDKMLYICFPYDGTVEVHGFEKERFDWYAGARTSYVARGGMFGGNKASINEMNSLYYDMLYNTISSGYMGTEESIFTLLTYKYPKKCNLHFIEPNGLIYKFFEDLRSMETKKKSENPLAIYVLVYNIPQQFEMWINSFLENYPEEFNSCKKYVINNSDFCSNGDVECINVQKKYKELFDKYNFEEFKLDNYGICDGRHFAAEHFARSEHDYMIFFEDDMTFYKKGEICRNGLTTWQDKLFEKSIEILEYEKLDYLKLSFSEFYGSAETDWAWYNVPKSRKDELFPDNIDNPELCKKTKIKYINNMRGITYGVGDFHYCNWPILFTKQGNQKIFLDDIYEHKYEQTWMSLTKMLMHEGKIKAGCLFCSPILHNRAYHYDGTKRAENKHYKKRGRQK